MLQPTAMFLASLLLAFVGTACVFKLAGNVLVVAAGDALRPPAGDDQNPILTWPRDRAKIVAYSLAAVIIGAICFGLSYVLALGFFHGGL